MWKYLLILCGVFRLVLPPLLFVFPLPVIGALLLLDSIDGHFAFYTGWRWHTYHRYDKLLDWWFYVWILGYSYGTPVFPALLALFLFRSIGQFLALAHTRTIYLVWFPNVFEKYFLFFVLSWFIPSWSTYFYGERQVVPLVLSLIIALVVEYLVHIHKKNVGGMLFHLHINWKRNEKRRSHKTS